jgi:hypothetical protein
MLPASDHFRGFLPVTCNATPGRLHRRADAVLIADVPDIESIAAVSTSMTPSCGRWRYGMAQNAQAHVECRRSASVNYR